MFRWQRFQLVLAGYGALVSTGAFITALVILLIPSDPRNSVFLGFSIQRLVLIGNMLLAGSMAAGFAVKAFRNRVWSEQLWRSLFGRAVIAGAIRWGAVIVFAAGWIASFTPLYRYWDFKDYFVRISPIIIWLTFVCALTIAISWIEQYGLHWQRLLDVLRAQKKTLMIVLVSMTVFTLTWIMIAATGMGIQLSEDYWYGTGVPILGLQILLALALGLGMFFLERSSFKFPPRSDLLLFLLIWALAAFLWAREPLQPSYFATGPHLPDFEFHPYSDAVTFDLASQYALIGQGINNGVFFDRALYMGFLVFLHALAGQNYAQVAALQAAIFAVFPAILYLLGKTIHSRFFGVTLAALAVLRGINSIAASNIIDLANQKQMLTDFPLVVFAAWFALMAVKWLKAPNKNYPYAIWAGGIVGLAIMIRTHALFFLLFAILLAVILYWRQKLRGLIVTVLLVAAMFASILPWGTQNNGTVFDIYMVRIRTVFQSRYLASFAPASTPDPALPTSTALDQETVTPDPGPVPVPTDNPPPSNAAATKKQSPTILISLTTHFLHNVVTSIFILPTSLVVDDLRHTVTEAAPFWRQSWDGSLEIGTAFFLILNLLLISLGIGISWKFAKLAGLIPLGVFLFYHLANAFARTSGGRYIVPVDWVVFFYFALGLLQIILWGLSLFKLDADVELKKTADDGNDLSPWTWDPLKRIPWIILIFLFIGALLPLSETLFPKRYPVQTQAELLTMLDEKGYLQEMGFDKATLQAVSDQWPSFRIIDGRAMYPRYFVENKGEAKKQYPYLTLGYPRLAFTVIGSQGTSFVILPEDDVPYFPNASDVFVLGCQTGQDVDALAVVVIQEETAVYVRQPVSPLQCPLQEPVCNNNHVCR